MHRGRRGGDLGGVEPQTGHLQDLCWLLFSDAICLTKICQLSQVSDVKIKFVTNLLDNKPLGAPLHQPGAWRYLKGGLKSRGP